MAGVIVPSAIDMISKQARDIAIFIRQAVKEMTYGNDEIKDNMQGACAIASYTLWLAYNSVGIKSILANKEDHCWIELLGQWPWSESIIVDITATQFSKRGRGGCCCPDVFTIQAETNTDHYDYRQPTFRGRETLMDLEQWIEEQCPRMY